MDRHRSSSRPRKRIFVVALLALALLVPVACVTINVYFPEAAADKAAGEFVDKVIGGATTPADAPSPPPGRSPAAMLLDFVIPSAAAQQANLNVQSPQIQAIQTRMQRRFASSLLTYFGNGAVGFGNDGSVVLRNATAVPLPERAGLNAAIADENRDRQAVYREIALANGHADWEAQIRASFARQWIQQAKPGWYYQDPGGAWKQK